MDAEEGARQFCEQDLESLVALGQPVCIYYTQMEAPYVRLPGGPRRAPLSDHL